MSDNRRSILKKGALAAAAATGATGVTGSVSAASCKSYDLVISAESGANNAAYVVDVPFCGSSSSVTGESQNEGEESFIEASDESGTRLVGVVKEGDNDRFQCESVGSHNVEFGPEVTVYETNL